MNYRVIDPEHYYRKGVYRHFTEDCRCSTSMTARLDVTELVSYSRETGTKFYLNFLYLLSKVLNSREDYRMGYLWQTKELICYDVIHPIQYVFHEDTETCTPVYSEYCEDYDTFYANALRDLEAAKQTREYGLDSIRHPNWFDASYLPWLSYDALHLELPDGYLHFAPIINWGKYRKENGRLRMPVSVRLNHAIADGYLVANVFRLLEREMKTFVGMGSLRIQKVDRGTELQQKLLEFVEGCSWTEVKDHTAKQLRDWDFQDWETPFAATVNGRVVGMATLMKTDYYPLPEIYPWVSTLFVTEDCRGHRISGKLIECANQYAKSLGFQRTYIPTEFVGIYEKYGYSYVKDIVNYGNGVDRLYVKELE